ncbi:MAG: helix-turn-helix domain-containing protein [Acidobacteriaceae bacterium]
MSPEFAKKAPTSVPADPLLSEYLTEKDFAKLLGKHPTTLWRWDRQRIGPPRIQVGNLILYSRTGIAEWLRAKENEKTKHLQRRRAR